MRILCAPFFNYKILKMSINAEAPAARLAIPSLPDVMLEPLVRAALLEDLGLSLIHI